MPSTYTLNNGIELIATGEQSGTWGDTTNTNLSLLDTALDGQVTVTLASAGTSGSPNNLPITDGSASDGRNRMVIFNDGADLGATAYVQLTPNDAEKIIYIRNDLSGSRSIILFQGTYSASNDYEVPAGTTAVVYFDGAGSGAVAANVFNNAYFDSLRLGSVSVTAILDEDNMASDSATALATQQSIKAYVDTQVGANNELSEVLANGNTTGGTDIAVSSGDDITFADSSKAIFGAGSHLQIFSDGTKSYLIESGTGDLEFRATDFVVKNAGNTKIMASFNDGGTVQLRYDNAVKLATTTSGVDITGTALMDGLTVSNTSAALTPAATFYVNRNGGTPSAAQGLQIYNNTSGGFLDSVLVYGNSANSYLEFGHHDGTSYAKRLRINSDGSSTFYSGAVFNEDGNDSDFRVESDTNTHMLFVDAGSNRVGINNSTPAKTLHVSNPSLVEVRVQNSTNNYALDLGMNDTVGQIKASADLALMPGGIEKWRIDSSGNVTQTNTATGAAAGPYFTLDRNSASPADSDLIGILSFRGRDDGANATDYGIISAKIADVTGGTEDGVMLFNVISGGTSRDVLTLSHNESVFNNGGVDQDFRVESDTNTHALFVDAGLNVVSVGNSAPENWYSGYQALQVGLVGAIASNETGSDTDVLQITSNAYLQDVSTLWKFMEGSVGATRLQMQGQDIQFYMSDAAGTANSTVTWHSRMRIDTGGTTFNEVGADLDFRVESDNNSNMLVVNAGDDGVVVGGTAVRSSSALTVHSSSEPIAVFVRNDIGGADTSGTTGLYLGDVSSGVIMLSREKTSINTADVVLAGEYGFNTRDERLRLSRSTATVTINGGQNAAKFASAEAVFNDDGYNRDFRVESETNTHAFFLDAGLNRFGFFDSLPSAPITVKVGSSGGSLTDAIQIKDSGYVNIAMYSGGADGEIRVGAAGVLRGAYKAQYAGTRTSNDFHVGVQDTTGMFTIDGAGAALIINERGAGTDFRVESDAQTHLFFVDASTNQVRIGTQSAQVFPTIGPQLEIKTGGTGAGGLGIKSDTSTSSTRPAYASWTRANGAGTTAYAFQFYDGPSQTQEGSITVTSSGTSFNTTSDYRIKENVVDLSGATERLKQLEPKRFNFIKDGDTPTIDGFLAHEVSSVVPEAVTGTHNEVDENGDPVYQAIDQSKLVPLLTAALQEAITKIEDLETRIAALENA